jgi:hypothetical protein
MKSIVAALLCASALMAHAQDTTKPPVYGWHHSIVSGLSLTQVAYSNWTQGGDNSLAYSASLQGKSALDEARDDWSTEYKFAFGQARLGDQGLKKTDDQINISTVYTYKLGTLVNPYASASLTTQFAKGYHYDSSGGRIAVSNIFDPAYLLQSAGIGYQPVPEVKTRLGLALREILTSEFPSYADDPATTTVEKTSVKGGLESSTDVEWHVADNLLLTSKLQLFSAFKEMDEVIIRSDNTLAAQVNKYVTVLLTVQVINEKPISPRTQVKEALAIGVTYALL